MKRLILFFLCACMVMLPLAACTPDSPDEGTSAADTAAPTAAPTDPAEDPTNEPEAPDETDAPAKGGCKASVSLSALLALCGAALVIRKKRED